MKEEDVGIRRPLLLRKSPQRWREFRHQGATFTGKSHHTGTYSNADARFGTATAGGSGFVLAHALLCDEMEVLEGATVMKIRLEKRDSLLDAIDTMQRRIAERALELFHSRGGEMGRALDDWVSAERETVWRPPVEVVEKDGEFLVEAALAGINPKELDVQVTPGAVLIQGNGAHRHRPGEIVHSCEFRPGRLFRAVEFPRRVDPDQVRADYQNGLLRVWARAANEPEARKVEL
jgi:HSP20 family protein